MKQYSALELATNIKNRAKDMDVTVKNVFQDCNLSKDTMSSMSIRGSFPRSDNLAKIADHLDCSVDYLLGRTDVANYTKGNSKTALEQKISQEIKHLSEDDQKIILRLVERLNHK